MARVASPHLPIGTPLPDFSLPDVVSSRVFRRGDFLGGRGVLVVFLCRHCPFVVHMRDELVRIADAFAPAGVRALAVSSNDVVAYPDDSPARLREMAVRHDFSFPLLFDETQAVARAFQAVCTPDIFLYDGGGRLFYRGRMDASTPGSGRPVTGADLRAALDALLAGSVPPDIQHASVGCGIKWK